MVEGRATKFDWPIILVYGIVFLLLVGVSVIICVCFCDKNEDKDKEEEEKLMDENETLMNKNSPDAIE